jgi:DNA-nicking Smr family endonuclease
MKKVKAKSNPAHTVLSTMPYEDMFREQATLDMHEFLPLPHDEIRDMIRKFIEEQYKMGSYQIKIITGKGVVVRPMTLKILSKSPYVKQFRFAGYYTGQDGAIEILLAQ